MHPKRNSVMGKFVCAGAMLKCSFGMAWCELLAIPYGQTTTYGAIAKRINCRSAQAVGQAIHRNPIAIIIPCHRVIGSNGSLTGYAAGLEIKQELLTIEKATEIILIQTQTPSPHSPTSPCQNG